MRYFRATCIAKDLESNEVEYQKDYLYEVFEKEAFLGPFQFRHGRRHTDEGYKFGISLICKDMRFGVRGAEAYIRKALDIWEIHDLVNLEIEECTFRECLLEDGNEYWRFNDKFILQTTHLHELSAFLGRPELLWENLLHRPLSQKEALEQAQNTGYEKSLTEELGRIYAEKTAASEVSSILPVHYLVECTNFAFADKTVDTLLGALFNVGRLRSRHVFHFNLDRSYMWRYVRQCENEDVFFAYINEALAEAFNESTLVIEYGKQDTGGSYDILAYRALIRLIEKMRPYHNSTQIVFLIPPDQPELKARLHRQSGVALVEIRQDEKGNARQMTVAGSMRYLRGLARESDVEEDDDLSALLKARMRDKSFTDLDGLFEEWKQAKLTCEHYPQYQKTVAQALQRRLPSSEESAMQRLDRLIGLEEVKQQVKDILLRFRMNKEVSYAGLRVQPLSLHLAFLGSPGTGKTEVAKLYGEILKEEGILKEGRVISVSGADCWNVERMFEAAKGSVLFVDEAYGMLSRSSDVVTEFIACMENYREDTVVILAGYENSINRLLDSNPGFRSRLGFSIAFPDYSTDELLKIFKLMCDRADLILSEETISAARDVLARGGRREDQGNARFVRKLFEDSIGSQQTRLARSKTKKGGFRKTDLQTILPQDLGYKPPDPHQKSARQMLADLVGLEEVKQIVAERLDFTRMQKIKRDAGMGTSFLPMHMAFKGNPGSGKTEVARLVGRILQEEGVLSVGDFYECGRQDLVGQFVGGTAPKIEALFRRAKGSVIFIDEAYSLCDGQKGGFGDEAITTIVDQMEKLREDVVVIFAGYTQEIDHLFSQNPGFKSRVGCHIEFPDYSTEELLQILEFMAQKEEIILGPGVKEKAKDILQRASKQDAFGNARFVRNLLEGALVKQGARLSKLAETRDSESAGPSKGKGGDTIKSAAIFDKQELATLLPEDFGWVAPAEKPQLGFFRD